MAVWLSPFEHLARINSGLYLESGFYDLRSSGKCTADAYKPAILQYDTETASYVTGTDTPLQGTVGLVRKFWEVGTVYIVGARITPYSEEDLTQVWECIVSGTSGNTDPLWDSGQLGNITTDGPDVQWQYDPGFDGVLDEEPYTGEALVEGMLSQSVGCKTLADEVTDPCGTNWVSQEGPAYCPDVFTKKDAQYKVPSSTYSGKLALYVQALYGSKRDDYEPYGQQLRVGGSDEEHPPRILQRGFSESGWVYTTAKFDYFFCVFEGGYISFYPMDLSEEARRFKDTLSLHTDNSFDFVKRVEAYVLSTARINKTATHVVQVIGPDVLGSPLDYGWHANWKGDEASVVAFYKDPLHPQYLSTQHQLAITELWDGSVYTFTCSNNPLITDAPWWPWTNSLHLFYFSEGDQSMIPVEYPAIIFGGYEGVFDAPIYNYYVLDEASGTDTLVTCDIFMDVQSVPDIFFDLEHGTRFNPPTRFRIYERKSQLSSPGEKGFRVGGAITSLNVQETQINRLREEYTIGSPQDRHPYHNGFINAIPSLAYPTTVLWGVANGLTPGDTKDIYWDEIDEVVTCVWGFKTKWYYMGRERWDVTDPTGVSGRLFFEVLKGDCAGVVTGENSVAYAEGTTVHERRETVGGNNGVHRPWEGNLVWFFDNAFWQYPVLETIAGQPADQAIVYDAFETFATASTILYTEEPAYTDRQDTILNTYPKGAKIQALSTEVGNPEYFSPTISDKPTHTVDTGRRSIGNLYKVNHADFDKDGGFINDSSVGWT